MCVGSLVVPHGPVVFTATWTPASHRYRASHRQDGLAGVSSPATGELRRLRAAQDASPAHMHLENHRSVHGWSGGTKSDSETALYSETSLQKLFRCIQKLFRCIQKLLYSETISSYSETLFVVFRNYFVVFRNYFVVFRNYFVVFRNYFRCIQKLFSSYSETIFVVFRNYCSSCSETSIPKLGGNVNNRTRGQLMLIQGGVGGLGWGSKLP